MAISTACSDTDDIKTSSDEEYKKSKDSEVVGVDLNNSDYDELQNLYLTIDDTTTYDDLLSTVTELNLFHNEHEFSSGPTIKVAFDEGVTKFKHADSGDYVNISFNEDKRIDYVEYFNHEIFITLLDYRNGTYWDFRDNPEYKGYYINTYNDKAGSFTIKYDNGNEKETDYLKVNSKEEQLKYMYEYAVTKEE